MEQLVPAAASFCSPIPTAALKSSKLLSRATSACAATRTIHSKRLFQDACGSFCQMIVAELVFAGERHIRDVAPGAGLTGDTFAQIVHNNVVKTWILLSPLSDGAIVSVNSIEYLNQFEHANPHARFFQKLASDSLLQRFAKLQRAARNGPLAAQRLAPAADQEGAATINDHAAYSDHRSFGVLSGRSHTGGPCRIRRSAVPSSRTALGS